MTFRTRFLSWSGLWIVLVGAALLIGPLVLRGRLPDPVASHWGDSGRPDDAMPLGWLLGTQLTMWLVIAGVALGALTGFRIMRRTRRAWAAVTLAAGGVFVLVLAGHTLWANLDIAQWRAARPLHWSVFALLLCCVPAGWLGWYLARFGPDERPDKPATAALERQVSADENVVWVSVASNAALRALALIPVAVLLVGLLAGPGVFGSTNPTFPIVLGVSAVVMLALSSVRVRVDRGGVRIAVGPARWPRRRIALDRLDGASVEQRRPRHVGGWGYRGLPGNATIMIRSGECLILHYAKGGELGISVADAERGAALINALLAERTPTSR